MTIDNKFKEPIQLDNRENPVVVNNQENPTIGAMGRKVNPASSWDSEDAQYRQALKPVGETTRAQPMRRNQGLTVIELMVVGASLTMLTIGMYAGFYGLKALTKYANTPDIQVERVNVVGDNRAEKFIDFNGERFYSEKDGKRVEDLVVGE